MRVKFTKADKIILGEMSFNSRILEKELAKKCNLSKDSIRYRIARLEKLGAIRGYGVFVDYTQLGYESYKLYMRLNATFEQKNKLRGFLKSRSEVFATFESNGNWDMAVAVFSKTRREYNNFENELLAEFGELIVSKDFCLMMDVEMFNYDTVFENVGEKIMKIWEGESTQEIDDKDKILIRELHKNSRASLVKLSSAVDLSVDAISKRLKKLEEKRVIAYHTTNIDYSLLGLGKYKMFVYVKDYSKEIERGLYDFLKNKPNAANIVRTLGPWKLEVEFYIDKHETFEKILSEMQEKFSEIIQRLDYSIFRNEVMFPAEELLG